MPPHVKSFRFVRDVANECTRWTRCSALPEVTRAGTPARGPSQVKLIGGTTHKSRSSRFAKPRNVIGWHVPSIWRTNYASLGEMRTHVCTEVIIALTVKKTEGGVYIYTTLATTPSAPAWDIVMTSKRRVRYCFGKRNLWQIEILANAAMPEFRIIICFRLYSFKMRYFSNYFLKIFLNIWDSFILRRLTLTLILKYVNIKCTWIKNGAPDVY